MRRSKNSSSTTALTVGRTLLATLVALASCGLGAAPAWAQIRVHPTGVNVDANGPTVVFLTYGELRGYEPVEAAWCGELVDAFPDFGSRCDPATVYGYQPLRHALAVPSGEDGFTDVMTIPASVVRRAYQAAERGADSRFFYVRRFADPFGASPDVYVAVTCRMAGGGARVPFALVDVQMAFAVDAPVLAVERGEPLPPLAAEIAYNGTGSLRGRWEVVLPGDEPPTERDLLTEATLPVEERSLQRRYVEVGRFSHFLPPAAGARFVLPGPDPERLPSDVEGLYMVLLRIEAADDKEGDSDLSAAGAGAGVVHSGAVAGFPIPPLRYFVGSAQSVGRLAGGGAAGVIRPLLPAADAVLGAGEPLDVSWSPMPQAALYRVEVKTPADDRVAAALLPPAVTAYRVPPWVWDRADDGVLLWRTAALRAGGDEIARTEWRRVRGAGETPAP